MVKDGHRACPPVPSQVAKPSFRVSLLQVPHLLKVTLENSPYFQLVGPNDVCRKVPPGLYKTVRILFTPGQRKVSLQGPRGWCLQWKVDLQGWIQGIWPGF